MTEKSIADRLYDAIAILQDIAAELAVSNVTPLPPIDQPGTVVVPGPDFPPAPDPVFNPAPGKDHANTE